MRELKLIAGRSHPTLANEIAECLNQDVCRIDLGNFASGEISLRIGESVRGCDVFIMQTHSANVNDAIIEQALMIDAAKRSSAASITAVCPFMGYARQDRKSGGREPISAKLIIDILSQAGADRIMSVDLHSGQIQGFFDGPFDHLIARPILEDYMKEHFDTSQLVVVSPDAGRVKSAERFSSDLNCEMAIIHKQRSLVKKNTVEARYLIGDVKDKICVITDDMIDTAGTICAAADLLTEHGAAKIYGVATHGILSPPAIERIEKSAFSQIIVTNTLPSANENASSKIKVLSIAPLIANTIMAIYQGDSVSAIFGGKNQI
jgi:ribose-phosphate pyrophosphokinase